MNSKKQDGISHPKQIIENGEDLLSPNPATGRTKCIKGYKHYLYGKIDIWVTPAVYKIYWSSRNKEMRTKNEESRCTYISTRKTICICRKDCSKCEFYTNRKSRVFHIGDDFEVPDDTYNPEKVAEHNDRMRRLKQAINELEGKNDKTIITLALDDKSNREIASVLNVSEAYVSKRMKQIISMLREKLKEF